MLVLARKKGETIVINNTVKIVVIEHDKYRIKLGIEAPRSVSIVRGELLNEKEQADAEDQQPSE